MFHFWDFEFISSSLPRPGKGFIVIQWLFIDEAKSLAAEGCRACTMHMKGTMQQYCCSCGGWSQGSSVPASQEEGSGESSQPVRHRCCQKTEEEVQWHFIQSHGALIARVLHPWFKPQDHPHSAYIKVILLKCVSSMWYAVNYNLIQQPVVASFLKKFTFLK